jgi:hypothetical protein
LPSSWFNEAMDKARRAGTLLGRRGATRPASPESAPQSEQERALEAAKRRIERQRRKLAYQEQRIETLETQLLTVSNRHERIPADRQDVRGPVEQGKGTLPDFAVIGTMKGGTTFFYRLLTQHPAVRSASRKEVQFFDLNFDKGVDWYRSHFRSPAPDEERASITGEATPYYLYHPSAAARMARVVPDARLIILLRNPVDRAYSHYNHAVRAGQENLTFEDAIEVEELRLRGETGKMAEDNRYNSFNHRWFSYLSRGLYADQVSTWLDAFGKDQMLIMKSEDFFADRSAALGRATDFLGLTRWEFRHTRARGRSYTGNRYGPIAPATRKRLDDYFRQHNLRLYELLGVDFGW